MSWWYENEEEKMELYKNEDLCIECKNEFFSKPWDHRDPTPGTIGYCIKCDNFLIKEKKMEFDKSRVYTSVNADELKTGDKVIAADDLSTLRRWAESGSNAVTSYLLRVRNEEHPYRFILNDGTPYLLAYLVERKENCTNCEEAGKEGGCRRHGEIDKILCCDCYTPKTEQKAEKHYRPFKDTDELIKVWDAKYRDAYGLERINNGLTMPLIWVRRKDCNYKRQLITKFSDPLWVIMSTEAYNMTNLFEHFTFLDGSPCGVEE